MVRYSVVLPLAVSTKVAQISERAEFFVFSLDLRKKLNNY